MNVEGGDRRKTGVPGKENRYPLMFLGGDFFFFGFGVYTQGFALAGQVLCN
jgi:hypothetical protein